jgi:hypothetical protein
MASKCFLNRFVTIPVAPIITGIIIINQRINRYLLTCRFNSENAYYKASTKTQIQRKNSTNTQNKHYNKQTKENNITGKNI